MLDYKSDINGLVDKVYVCDYNASTRTVLKRHNTLKHKGKGSSKENDESDIPLTLHKKALMTNLTIPPFKHPVPDQNKIQETEFTCDQCGFKCNSELVLKHHTANKLMKPLIIPPPYSDIDPKENNSECAYCDLKFVGLF